MPWLMPELWSLQVYTANGTDFVVFNVIIISLIAATCSLTGSLNFGSLLQLKLMISIGKLYEKTKPRKEKQRRNILKGPFYTRLHDFNGSKQNAMLNADCACALSHA